MTATDVRVTQPRNFVVKAVESIRQVRTVGQYRGPVFVCVAPDVDELARRQLRQAYNVTVLQVCSHPQNAKWQCSAS